jgi:tRNA threonylcarbamoyladenosine biosynthesis protein TsaB
VSAHTLAIDTATAACSVALFDENGRRIAHAHESVGRGHAERLLPMIAALPEGGRAGRILVDVGPGSFTGIRVGLAAARALGLGWGAEVAGYSSTWVAAAAAFARRCDLPALAVVLEGGHGEVFMQPFTAPPLDAAGPLASLPPAAAAQALGALPAVGDGVRWLVPLLPGHELSPALPDAGDALLLPPAARVLPPRPLYGRAPDAKIPARR